MLSHEQAKLRTTWRAVQARRECGGAWGGGQENARRQGISERRAHSRTCPARAGRLGRRAHSARRSTEAVALWTRMATPAANGERASGEGVGRESNRRRQRWHLCVQDSPCAPSPGHALRLRPLPRPCCAGGDGKPQGADDTICLEAGPGSCDAMAEALRDMWKVVPLPNPQRVARRAARAPGMRTRGHLSGGAGQKWVGGPECVGDLKKCESAAALFG